MFNILRKIKQALFYLLFLQLLAWAIMSLAGCGGREQIPSASILRYGQVKLMWEDVAGAVAYNVYLSKSPNVTVLNSYKIPNTTSPITITDLELDTTYYFVVAWKDNSGQVHKSKEISYTVVNTEGSIQFGDILNHPEPKTAVLDSKPAGKGSTPETSDVALGWNDVANATSYNIYYSDKPGVTKKNGIKISNVKNPHKITGLKKGKKYYFVVTAVNASAESKESEEVSFSVGR